MHDIWNPWHGCRKVSEGCEHCYMYFLDAQRGGDGSRIYRTKAGFDYPVQRDRAGAYKIKSGELIRVCMTSDFFLEEADAWRDEAWDLIRRRPDVKFFLLTKRAERIRACLPPDWGDGWDNVMLNVTAENDRRARQRIPVLLGTPAKHRGVMCAPLVGEVDLAPYLSTGMLEQVICGGENYDGARVCRYGWVKRLSDQCRAADVTFAFIETGTVFEKDGKTYRIPSKRVQSGQAFKSGLSHAGRPIEWVLRDPIGFEVDPAWLYEPYFAPQCDSCGSRLICNGCTRCGACG
jgi:protein gp37